MLGEQNLIPLPRKSVAQKLDHLIRTNATDNAIRVKPVQRTYGFAQGRVTRVRVAVHIRRCRLNRRTGLGAWPERIFV